MSDHFEPPEERTQATRFTLLDRAARRAAGGRGTDRRLVCWRIGLLALSGAASIGFVICLLDGHAGFGLKILAAAVIVLFGLMLS